MYIIQIDYWVFSLVLEENKEDKGWIIIILFTFRKVKASLDLSL